MKNYLDIIVGLKARMSRKVIDIGYGTDSFNFEVAEVALKQGTKAHPISTDVYSRNRINGPVYNFATTLEK